MFNLVCLLLTAQTPFFRAYPLEERFPGAVPKIIYEDPQGPVWVGSTQGLFLFDGESFQPSEKPDSTSNRVTAIFRDRTGVLWAGFSDGYIYHQSDGKLSPWQPEEGLPKAAITGFAEDATGKLWFSTYGEGLYYLDEGRLYNINTDDGLLANDIYTMAVDKLGRIWAGTDGGINICMASQEQKQISSLTTDDGLPDDIVKKLLPDTEGNIWIGMYDHGVCQYLIDEAEFSYPIEDWTYGEVNSLSLFEGVDLWIGTNGQGLVRYNLGENSLEQITGWEKEKVTDLLKDMEGNLWTVSNGKSISVANRQFESISLEGMDVQAICRDLSGRLWLGTRNGLFELRKGAANAWMLEKRLPESVNVISLYADNFSNIWAGTFDEGLYCLNTASGKLRHLDESNGLTNNNVLSIAGLNAKLWLATLGGVNELSFVGNPVEEANLTIKNYNQESGLGTNFIYKVFVDSKGRTWFGTDGKGLSMLDKGSILNYPSAKVLNPQTDSFELVKLHSVYSIAEDKSGRIWFSTDRDGVFAFDGENFRHLTMKEGISELEISALAATSGGDILIIHPNGIDLLNPETGHLIYYDENAGVGDLEAHLNAVCSSPPGSVWIGGKDRIIRFVSLNEQLEIHPRIRLTGVSVFLEPIDFRNTTSFSYKQNNLVFNYLGLWYTDPAAVKYRYKLEGYDPAWRESRDRQAVYSNLLPGEYTFMITGTENEAWSDEPVITYKFTIAKPLWQRWWFIGLCIIVGFSLFYTYVKLRDQRVQRVNLLEKEMITSQLNALKAQINPHFLFNSFNTLITIIEEDPEMAVEYVEKLSDFYRSILQLRDKEVITIEEETELLKNYYYLLQKRFGDSLKLDIQLNGTQGYVVPLTFQVLLENAIKHNVISKSKPLQVRVSKAGNGYVRIANNIQPKTVREPSTRFGLQSLEKRYDLLANKQVKIHTDQNEFIIDIPILESASN
ncbi:MAG: hypothetical protein Kow0027_04130 [Saprospiraceae bacterium]